MSGFPLFTRPKALKRAAFLALLLGSSFGSAATLVLYNNNGVTNIANGGTTLYRIRIDNTGGTSVSGVTLKVTLPSGTSINTTTTNNVALNCTPTANNACSSAPTPAQVTGGYTISIPANGFYAILVPVNVPSNIAAGTVLTTTATISGVTNTASNTATDTDTVVVAPVANSTTWNGCDTMQWGGPNGTSASSANSTAAIVTAGTTVNRTLTSNAGLSLPATFTSTSGTNSGWAGYTTLDSNLLSWDEVRAVSNSIQGAVIARGGSGPNTLTINFPEPVINVRFAFSDMDATSSNNLNGDWGYATASYGGVTFNPDVLATGGTALPTLLYNLSAPGNPTYAAGVNPTTIPAGLGNSNMKTAGGAGSYNAVMGTALEYSTNTTSTTPSGTNNRQGQAVVYFKGPLTTLNIATGSAKSSPNGQLMMVSDINFCSPSITLSKTAGTPAIQSDLSYNIPYTLTYSNTSLNKGYFPDGTTRDDPFSPSIPTPSGSDPWADLKPQLSDTAVTQALANTNVASATIAAVPSVSNAVNTLNLTSADTNSAFTGTSANPTLLLATTDGRVSLGGKFDTNFTLNVKLKSGLTSVQSVSNQATATATLNQAGTGYTLTPLSATSNTTATSLTPAVTLQTTKTAGVTYVKYTGSPATPSAAQIVYTITVKNTNTSLSASNVTVTDTLPAGVTYASSSPAASVSGQTLTWTLPTLAANATATYSVTVNVPTAAVLEASQPQSAIVNTVSAAANNAATASATASTNTVYTKLFKQVHNIGPSPASSPVPLAAPAWSSSSAGLPGDVLEYCIDFSNLGSSALANYSLSDTVPANTTYVAGSAFVKQGGMGTTPVTAYSGASVSYASGKVTASIGTLNVGSTGSLCFRAKIN